MVGAPACCPVGMWETVLWEWERPPALGWEASAFLPSELL